jgi:hypothetical protein
MRDEGDGDNMRRLSRWMLNAMTVVSAYVALYVSLMWISGPRGNAEWFNRLTRQPFKVEYTPGVEFRDRLIDKGIGPMHVWTVPFWFALGIPMLLPTIRTSIATRRWYASARRGECMICRYDLTGNVSGVCPECGTKVDSRVPSTHLYR